MKIDIDFVNMIQLYDIREVKRKDGEIAFYEGKLLIRSDREIVTVMLKADSKKKLELQKSKKVEVEKKKS